MAQGGKSYNDRVLASEVRTLGLKKIKQCLEDEKNEKYSADFQRQLLLRLAGTLLPRLNEHTGEDGQPINIQFDKKFEEAGNGILKTTSEAS
jgi:hypothetical protein